MKPHVFHPEVAEKYTHAIQYYAALAPELGGLLYDEIERLIAEVRHQPDRFFRFKCPTAADQATLDGPNPSPWRGRGVMKYQR